MGKGAPFPDSISSLLSANSPQIRLLDRFSHISARRYAYRFFLHYCRPMTILIMTLMMMMMMLLIRLQELVSVYLDHHPDSITAINLRACNLFRLVGDHAAAVRYYPPSALYNLVYYLGE